MADYGYGAQAANAMNHAVLNNQMAGHQTPQPHRGAEQVTDALYKRCAQFEMLVSRLGSLSDRLLGPRPQEVRQTGDNSKGIVGATPFVTRLGGVDSQLAICLDEFERVLSGLESFV